MVIRKSSKRVQRKKVISWTVIIALIVLLVAFRLVEEIGRDITPSSRFTIVRVIDGDTVVLQGGDKLRLLSIDTPEHDEPFYAQAKAFLTDIALNKQARIEYSSYRRDKYGRLLGYLYIDSIFVNKLMLEKGLACLYLFKDTDMGRRETNELLQAQRRALQQKVGLWGLPHKQERYYLAHKGGFRFHRPNCSSVSKTDQNDLRKFYTREEALYEGLSPCRRCKP